MSGQSSWHSLAGSLIGSINFCAKHGLGAEIEVIRTDQINEEYERDISSDVRTGS